MKKFFTMRRIVLLLSLILVYSCAFLFVKVYAEKAIIDDSEPSSAALYVPKDGVPDNVIPEASEPAITLITTTPTEPTTISTTEPTTAPPETTTAPTTTETPTTTTVTTTKVTTTKATTTKATTTKATTTKAATTEPDGEEDINEDDIENLEGNDKENIDEVDEELTAEELEDPEEFDDPAGSGDDGLIPMTPEELQQLIEGIYGGGVAPAPTNPSDSLTSGNSYKNQLLTIYDTKNKRMRTENAFDLVCEITNCEVGDSMDPEAIKAQAIAVYTYCKYYEQKGEYAEIGTKGNVPDLVRECVEAVDGLAMYYDGKYIMSAFSASTGGFSASSKNVWGGDLPYLQSVKNDFDYLDTKHYGKVTTYTVDEVRKAIESKTDIRLSNNYSEWIKILSYNDTVYAGNLSIDGHTEAKISGKQRTITAHYFRTYILNIRSAVFNVSYSNGVFTFTTYGYGHGVGLSQLGAHLYATYGGYTFDQILHHYFTGITIY